MTYLPYNANLTLIRYRRIQTNSKMIKIISLGTLLALIITENPEFLYNLIPNVFHMLVRFIFFIQKRNCKNMRNLIFIFLTFYIFKTAYEPISQTFCLLIFQIFSNRFFRITSWLPGLLIFLANDIHVNPGPQYQNTFFTFMTWNVNSQ